MAIRKSTVIRFLTKIAAAPMGLSQHELNRLHCRIHTRAALVALRDAEFPLGLKGLVRESLAPGKNNNPCTSCFVTSKGRRLLEDLKTDPNAMPRAVQGERSGQGGQPYRIKLFIAQQLQKNRQRKRNQEKYDTRMDSPTFHRNDYEQMPDESIADIHPNDPSFRELSSLERIKILRMRAGYTKPKTETQTEEEN